MFQRHIQASLHKALARSPVVLLNGARQVGKTTLVRDLLGTKQYHYVTFDDELVYLAAQANPGAFVVGLPKPVIIDEVQRVPEIFMAIKRDVDTNRSKGRYLLTGSANPLLIPKMGDSLAGRMEIIDIMPLSQGEMQGNVDGFVTGVFGNKTLLACPGEDRVAIINRVVSGGYPGIYGYTQEDRDAWMRSYLNLLLQKDIKDLASIEKLTELPNLLKLLALRAGGLLNVADIGRDCRLSDRTLHRYLALFEAIFIVARQPAWHANAALRMVKSPKVFMLDTGLLTYLIDMNPERALKDAVQFGKVLENFVVGELKKQATWNTPDVQLYHFRTAGGDEVDIVLEDRAGNVVGVEVKWSDKPEQRDMNGLCLLRDHVGKRFVRGIVLSMYPGHVGVDDRISLLPINALWQGEWK